MDNSTCEDLTAKFDDDVLSAGDADSNVLKESGVKTKIEVVSNTTFDVIGDYFNIVVQEFSGFFKPEMNCTFKV